MGISVSLLSLEMTTRPAGPGQSDAAVGPETSTCSALRSSSEVHLCLPGGQTPGQQVRESKAAGGQRLLQQQSQEDTALKTTQRTSAPSTHPSQQDMVEEQAAALRVEAFDLESELET